MKRVVLRGLLYGMGLTLAALPATAALTRPPEGPLGVHRWMPLPVACVGVSCVTYRRWSRALHATDASSMDVLSTLLEERVGETVAHREGIRITSAEIDQVARTLIQATQEIPGGGSVLRELYGADPDRAIRERAASFLLRQKLTVAGIPSPWDADRLPPLITVWNPHLRWDPVRHTIVAP